jgi:hypothetical protein
MANRILKMNGDQRPVSKLWLIHFIKRNPRVALVISRKLEALRAKVASLEQIRVFLELFKRT